MKQKLLLKRFHLNGHTVKFYLQTQRLEPPHKYTILVSDILKFILGCEAWGNKTKKIIVRLSNEYYISFVLFPQASEPSMYFDI